MLAHPDGPAVLGTGVARRFVHGLLLTDVPDPDLLVSRSGGEHVAAGVPGQALHNIGVLERQGRLARANVPELDGEVARRGSEDVFGRGVEENLSNLPERTVRTTRFAIGLKRRGSGV